MAVGLVTVVAVVVAALLGAGPVAVLPALALAVAGAVWAHRRSDAVVLAVSHADPADPATHPRLHNLVDGLCTAAGLPKPRLYVIDDRALNALTTGRDPGHAAVAVTTGLLERLDRVELEGVLAHELSHIKSHDILTSTLAVTVVGGATLLADLAERIRRWGWTRHRDEDSGGGGGPVGALVGPPASLLRLLAPLVSRAMQAALPGGRDGRADLSAVSLTRYPPGLVAALEKLHTDGTAVHSAVQATAHLWIAPPLAVDRSPQGRPGLGERIDSLREL